MNAATLLVAKTKPDIAQMWDVLLRIFHWSLVVSFLTAYLLDDGGAWHEAFGYAVLGLLTVRLVWGVAGGQRVQFTRFGRALSRCAVWVSDLALRRQVRLLDYGTLNALLIVILLLSLLATGMSGWLLTSDAFWGSEVLESMHEWFANSALLLAGCHVTALLIASLRYRKNLLTVMLTGRKRSN